MIEHHEHKWQTAIEIALEAGVLQECEYHDSVVFEGSEDDITVAYRLGSNKYTAGNVSDVFRDEKEMKDYIRDVVDDNFCDECPSCARIRDKG